MSESDAAYQQGYTRGYQRGQEHVEARSAHLPCSALTLDQLEEIVRKDLKSICSIYPTVGNAFYDEPEARLIGRIAHSIYKAQKKH